MFCARVAMEVAKGPSVSTGSRSTHRLGRPARVDLTSTTIMFKPSLRHAEELVTELRRALMDLHGTKSLSAFARDEYYIGPSYEVTGPKDRPT